MIIKTLVVRRNALNLWQIFWDGQHQFRLPLLARGRFGCREVSAAVLIKLDNGCLEVSTSPFYNFDNLRPINFSVWIPIGQFSVSSREVKCRRIGGYISFQLLWKWAESATSCRLISFVVSNDSSMVRHPKKSNNEVTLTVSLETPWLTLSAQWEAQS